jgi:hypothetical protein
VPPFSLARFLNHVGNNRLKRKSFKLLQAVDLTIRVGFVPVRNKSCDEPWNNLPAEFSLQDMAAQKRHGGVR